MKSVAYGVGMISSKCRIGALVALALLLTTIAAFAQVPPGELPGRERERFREPEAPRAQPGGPTITLPSTVAPAGAEKVTVTVRDVEVVGSTIYRAEELAALFADLVGHRVTLATVYEIAQRITTRYGNDGYVLSRAIVPPQQLSPTGATVRIQVIEGYVDTVVWPSVLLQYRDFFSYYTARIIADRPTNVRTLERYLLLAGDLPGMKFKNSLKPSPNKQGAATLVIEVEQKPIDALARYDNRGTRARGPLEYLGSATFNNLLHMHESLSVTYAGTTQTKELHYLAGSYRQVLTPEGLTAFVNASASNGRPGIPELELFDYKTRSTFLESGLTYPIVRQREKNLAFSLLWFMSHDESDILATINSLDRLRGVRFRAETDFADPINGINQITFVLSHGFEGAGSTLNGNPFASRANGRVDFTKAEWTISRVQPLPMNFSLLTALYAQYAVTPLLASELCGYGGRYFGRAYDPSDLVSDSCLELLGELRYDIPHSIKELTQAQLYAFADHGSLHNIAPVRGTLRDIDAASTGAGVRVGWLSNYMADLSVSKAIEGPRNEWRYFFILTGRY
jgi:hemolysin activation/secretion protein